MHITTTYEQTVEETYRGMKAALRVRRRVLWICTVIVLVSGTVELAVGQVVPGAVTVSLGAFLALQFTVRVKRSIAKALLRAPGPLEVVFDEDKAIFRKPGSVSQVAWHRYIKLAETPEFFLLHITKVMVVPVPKRALQPAEVAEVSAHLSTLANYSAR